MNIKNSEKQTVDSSRSRGFRFKFGNMPRFQLRDLTHQLPEWKAYYKKILDNDSMGGYFALARARRNDWGR